MTADRKAEMVLLDFERGGDSPERSGNLSAALQVENDLWVGSDEGTSVERLSPVGPREFGRHTTFDLCGPLDLPGGSDEEIDVEGLAYADGYLWVLGSHSVNRSKPDPTLPDGDMRKQVRRLSRTRRGGNQYLLGRLPLVPGTGGSGLEPRRKAPGGGHAARLPGGRRRNVLRDALREDDHLAPSLSIPGKDNGFDVEGLALCQGHAFLGLRGPVLRGWAVVLVLVPEPDPERPGRLRLASLAGKQRVYHKLFFDLHGLGIRDLVFDDSDLLILAGPTMPLDGDAVVLRWRNALPTSGDELIPREQFERILDLPYGRDAEEGVDHPEGLALLRDGETKSLLVVYDSPSERRRQGASGVFADRFEL
ncbi:MAG: DUF3616 domain-containing protein [Gemmatimonadales bacterium]|nr:DUF3616 domain-containing protein [Gemmatimonadales bacterium]MBA3554166.1 DUF3616 domain-containing protein [Gemmatimonadales bacterium]